MRQIRAAGQIPDIDKRVPLRDIHIYADDTDFINILTEVIGQIISKSTNILKSWNLTVNTDKADSLTKDNSETRSLKIKHEKEQMNKKTKKKH